MNILEFMLFPHASHKESAIRRAVKNVNFPFGMPKAPSPDEMIKIKKSRISVVPPTREEIFFIGNVTVVINLLTAAKNSFVSVMLVLIFSKGVLMPE